jgi:hypothetical protein
MTTIGELVSYQMAQTEQDLQSGEGLEDYASIKQSAIDRASVEFYGTNVPPEDQMGDIVKFYLSDVAVVYLIDTAIDWYQSRTVTRQTEGDETLQFYDRIASLRAKARELRQRIAQAEDRVKAIAFGSKDVGDVASLPLAQAQADKRTKVTIDPWKWARYLYGDLVQVPEGVEPRTVTADRP